ncbi:MAG: FecR domain-containing protein [Saprospiraceae bacterium]
MRPRWWQLTGNLKCPPLNRARKQAWARLEHRLGDSISVAGRAINTPLRASWVRFARVAAAIVVLAAVAWWIWPTSTSATATWATQQGERLQQSLPDGTLVWLNEKTTLTYEAREGERVVRLSGEAFFDVTTDSLRPFKIYADQSVTTVLGTSFNLRAYPQDAQVEVTVTEGRVMLEGNATPTTTVEATQQVLTPGDMGILTKSNQVVSVKQEVAATNPTAWKDRRLNFDEVPLAAVAATLERYYHLPVTLRQEGLGNCLFFGVYENDPPLDLILTMLQESLELEVQRTDEGIVLSGEPCE